MGSVPDSPAGPELIFGIAGPIGVDILAISDSLQSCLRAVRYDSEVIHLTKEMMIDVALTSPPRKPVETDFYSEVNYKIEYANQFCKEFGDAAALGWVALRAISRRREKLSGYPKKPPTTSTAYVIRQLKRPDEIALLRRVYGKQFILISAYGSAEKRAKLIEERLKRTLPPSTPNKEVCCKAGELIEKDTIEEDNDFGQRLRETFHLADVFY